jgi:hypothetical protein
MIIYEYVHKKKMVRIGKITKTIKVDIRVYIGLGIAVINTGGK